MITIRNGMGGMLQDASIIGQVLQVIKPHLREFELRNGFYVLNIQVAGARVPGAIDLNLAENLEVSSGYLFPGRLSTKSLGHLAHRL